MFQRSPEVEAVVRRYFAARDRLDIETLNNLHAKGGATRLIGSDTHEWYQGHDEVVGIQDAHLQEQRRTVSNLKRLEAYSNGDTAWAAAEMEYSFESGETFTARHTLVLVIESGSWRIAQMHVSIPVANEVVDGVELTQTLVDLLDSMATLEDSATLNQGIAKTATLLVTDFWLDPQSRTPPGHNRSDPLTIHVAEAQKIVEANGGTVVKTLGHGGMHVFPTAANALSAGIALQRQSMGSSGLSDLRIGIHSGDVVQHRSHYVGETVQLAVAVAAAARNGEILVSRSTAGMVNAEAFAFGDPVHYELTDLPGTYALQTLAYR